MPAAELDGWREFYLLHPFDDYHRYYRPAALMATTDAKDRNKAIVDSLKWLDPGPTSDIPDADARTLAAFGLKHPREK